jgi:hypothetical protein
MRILYAESRSVIQLIRNTSKEAKSTTTATVIEGLCCGIMTAEWNYRSLVTAGGIMTAEENYWS